MYLLRKLTRNAAALIVLLAMSLPALAADYTVYYRDSKDWGTVSTWIWDKNDEQKNYTGGTWPGRSITLDSTYPSLYSYTFSCPDSNPELKCIFNDGDKNHSTAGETQTADLQLKNGWVYDITGPVCHISEYKEPDPSQMDEYTIWFHNVNSWPNIYVRLSGNNFSATQQLSSFLNSDMFSVTFSAPQGTSLNCAFYHDNNQDLTQTFTVINNHVYTQSGDKGEKDSYDTSAALPEKEWWYEPSNPSQNDELTIYFNKAYEPDSKLKNQKDIYLYTWLKEGETSFGGADWGWASTVAEKHKMTQNVTIDPNGNVYSFTFSPSIIGWFNGDTDDRYSQLGFIFRDFSGDTKQHDADNFLNLRAIADPKEGLGAYQSYTDEDGTITLTAENGRLMLTPMSTDIVKVFTLRNNATVTEERPSISVVGEDDEKYCLEKPDYTISDKDNELLVVIENGIRIHVDKTTCQVSFHDSNDKMYLRELAGLVNKNCNVSVSFEGMEDDGFYGGGYNGNHINWNGKGAMLMNNTQTGGWYQGKSWPHNINVPFYVSSKGYGVYFDDHYRYATITPSSNGTTYSSRSLNPVAYYFIGGGDFNGDHASMETAMQNYTRLTGLQDLPPYWALGYITSRYGYHSQSESDNAINRIKNECNIPLDGIVFDLYWQGSTNAGMGNLEWYSPNFPNPEKMLQDYKDKGVNTICITEPFFTEESSNYSYLYNKGYFSDSAVSEMTWLTQRRVGLIDTSNKEAMEWMGTYYKKHTKNGMAGWWLDLGEPERHFPGNGCNHATGTCEQIHNEFGNLWMEGAYKALKEEFPDMRHILLPRAGTAGMQRFSAFPWTGDIKRSWEGLKAQVPALVSAAMSGISYLGSDIGGFCDSTVEDDALYLRWIQLGVFYPVMRTHAQEALAHGPEPYNRPGILNDVRDAINLRYAYLPYTYSQSYAYSRFGTPIARPANYNETDDRSFLSNEIGAYYWGPDLYVAPVLDSSTSKNITFPEGDWLDMNDWKTVYASHTSTNYAAPTNVIPHFMRRGSFVTRYYQDTFTNTAEIKSNQVIVDYFANYTDTFDGSTWYDDDHTSASSLRNGNYLVTNFSGAAREYANGNSMAIYMMREGNGWEGMYDTQDMLLRIHDFRLESIDDSNINLLWTYEDGKNAPRRATAITNEKNFTAANSVDELKADNVAGNKYYIDSANKTMYLRMPAMSTASSFALEIGNEGLLTGIERPAVVETMTLGYGNGYFTYSAPEGTENLAIEVFSTTGAAVAVYENLNADGYANQQEVSLPAGIYIARMTGRNSEGKTAAKTLKIVVR